MKKQLLALVITLFLSNFVKAQSISFTSAELTTAVIGSTVTVNYQYTVPSNGYIYCAINLLDDWTYISTVASGELNPAAAGTNVSGSFQLTIPQGTTPTASLTGTQNYKISMELKDSSFAWLAGTYPATQINFTESLTTTDFENNSLLVFPNPSADFIYLNGIDKDTISQVSIVDMLGKEVFNSSQVNSDKIDVSNLNSGIYILSISTDSIKKTTKFVKN
jgi:hypothetical protein